MSGHADTIRRTLARTPLGHPTKSHAHIALDALLAENQRLREALERARGRAVQGDWRDPVEVLEDVIRLVDVALAGEDG